MGFHRAVVSDVDSVGDILYGHHAVKDLAEASAMAIKAGNDECSGTSYRSLRAAFDRGLITEADLDRAASRLFSLRFRLGMFDSLEECAFNAIKPTDNDTPEHEQLALKAARESLVLLKNDGILPLDLKKYARVAVIGPVAKSQAVLVGNYNGTPARPVTLLDGIKAKLEAHGIGVEYAEGGRLVNRGAGVGPLPRGVTYADEAKTTPGLKGEVFGNPNLEGTPVGERIDRFLNLHWSTDQPQSGLPTENCSIQWSGYVVWPNDETVTLGVVTEGGVRLYVDDKLILDQWKSRESKTHRVDYAFKKGATAKIRLEYSHAHGAASIQLGSNAIEKATDYSQAEEIARRSDLVILTLGITPQLEGEQMPVRYEGFSGGDRTSILIPAPQRELLAKIAAVGKPIVVVITTGSAVSFDTKLPKGILLSWYSGEQGGNAVAEALVGESNPAGRLPVTFYRSDKDLPPFEDYHLDGRTYRYFKGQPLFPFGFGLSYARFKYGSPSVSKSTGGHLISLPITNTSGISGDEVVEIYARYDHPTKTDPSRRLVGFKRVSLQSGETKEVQVEITDWALRSWDETQHRYAMRPDGYRLEIGPTSDRKLAVARIQFP